MIAKALALAALLLLPAGMSFASPQGGESSVPGQYSVCQGLEQGACKATYDNACQASCYWDDHDHRCEPAQGCTYGGACGALASPDQCNADKTCFWDKDDNRCEPHGS